MADIIKSRRDTAEHWRVANPTLAEGELGFETDSRHYKLGDGITPWNGLNYRDNSDEVSALVAGTSLDISVSPSCIYKGEATEVTITATLSKVAPDSISIRKDNATTGEVIASGASSPLSVKKTYNVSGDNVMFYAAAQYKTLPFSSSVALQARHPIYYGFGVDAASVKANGQKLSPRTSAVGTYPTVAAETNGVNFFILVPTDISQTLRNFTMGGAPYVMERSEITLNGISYVQYKSGAVYNQGGEVSVNATT